MKQAKLQDMTKGWFVGDFEPSMLRTQDVEVGIKKYIKGDYEDSHFHKVATEITVIVSGRVFMFDQEFEEGDVVIIEPGESTSFEALTDAVTVVVKHPGVKNDKYIS